MKKLWIPILKLTHINILVIKGNTMKKYMLIALLPFIFQSKIYGDANLNKAIQPSLISARKAINNINVPLELDTILPALISFAKRGQDQSIEAISKIKVIGATLQQYKSDQYTTWSWYFGPTPQIVIDHIDPAIAQVDNALKTLKNNATNSGWLTIAAIAAGALALVGIGVGISWYAKQQKQNDNPEYKDYRILDLDYNTATAKDVDKQFIKKMDWYSAKYDQEKIIELGDAYNRIIKTDKYIKSKPTY